MTYHGSPSGGGDTSLVPRSSQPPAYRDPWLTQGWFARLVAEHKPEAPARPSDFRSAGNRLTIIAILAVQAVLSSRFLGASQSPAEGLSLWTGYLQAHNLITLDQFKGLIASSPGSPEIYPPAGALAAAIDGLSGARQLSLALMLFATCMLYGVTRRLWSARMPAIFAASLFAGLGSVQFLSASATSDAMGLALLALATWLAVRTVDCRAPARLGLLAAAAACLVAANAVLYPTIFFDPVVIAAAALATGRAQGPATGARALIAGGAITAVLGAGGYAAAGSQYQATIRAALRISGAGSVPAARVLTDSGQWLGILAVVSVMAIIAITWRHRGGSSLLALLLAAAALVAPALAVSEHSTAGLYPRAALGAWFGCAIAGWALALFFDAGKRGGDAEAGKPARLAWRGIAFLAVACTAAIGFVTTTARLHDWPDPTAARAELTRLITPNGEYLAEDYGQFAYDDRTRINLAQWTSTTSCSYLDPATKRDLTGAAAYSAAIRDRHFTVIVLDGLATPGTDLAIRQDIAKYHDYRRVASIAASTSSGPVRYDFWIPVS
jgi:hypothetical protein